MKLLAILCTFILLICCSNVDTDTNENKSEHLKTDEIHQRKIISLDTLNEYIKNNQLVNLSNLSFLQISDNNSRCKLLPQEVYQINNLDSLILFNFGNLTYLRDSICNIKGIEYLSIKFAPNVEVIDSRVFNIEIVEFINCGTLQIIEAPNKKNQKLEVFSSLTSLAIENALTAEVDLNKLEKLTVSNVGLTIFPEALYKCVNLSSLNLKENNIMIIGKNLEGMRSLINLNLSSNKFSSFPIEILSLPKIEEIDFSGNNIKSLNIPDSYPVHLKKLDISSCDFKVFPKAICEIETLEELRISNNGLTKIPKEIGQMQNLKILDLGMNNIQTLPDELKSLRSLEILIIGLNLNKVELMELQSVYNKALPNTQVYFYGKI